MELEKFNRDASMGRDTNIDSQRIFQLFGVEYIYSVETTRILKDNLSGLVKKQSLRRREAYAIPPVTGGAFDFGSLKINVGLEIPGPHIPFIFSLSSKLHPFIVQGGIYGGFGSSTIASEKKDTQQGGDKVN